MPQKNQIELIEKYHSGNMTSEEASLFEKQLASDPSLRAESEFQSNIINGIKEYRKAELKTRLNAIDVSPGWMEFVQQSALVKSFGGIAVATAIGSGVYFFAESKSEAPLEEEKVTDTIYPETVPEIEKLSFEWKIPGSVNSSKPELIKSESLIEEAPVEKAVPSFAKTAPIAEETVVPAEAKVAESNTEEVFTPEFSAPDAGEIFDENEVGSTELDNVPSVVESNAAGEPIKVETKISKSSKIRYKYYDGKLFLNGNFNKEPYEILEINSASGRRIYLLHARKYYEVKITDRLSELPEVTDVKLIRELRLIKANK